MTSWKVLTARFAALALIGALCLTGLGLPAQVAFAAPKVPEPTDVFYVGDFADVLSDETTDYIISANKHLYSKTGAQIVVVTVDYLGGTDIEDYAAALFDAWGIGSKQKGSGILLLLAVGEENYWAHRGRGMMQNLPGGTLYSILQNNLESDFAEGNYDIGVHKTFDALYTSVAKFYGISPLPQSTLVPHLPANIKFPEPTKDFYVGNFAPYGLSSLEIEPMIEKGKHLEDLAGIQIVMVTMNGLDGANIDAYAAALYDAWGIGSSGNGGALLFVDTKAKDACIHLGGKLSERILKSEMDAIIRKHFHPHFDESWITVANKIEGAYESLYKSVYTASVPLPRRSSFATNAPSSEASSILNLPEYTREFYVADFSKIIRTSPFEDIQFINHQLEKLSGAQIVVATVNNLGGEHIGDYAAALFAKWGIGSKQRDNGVLLLLSTEEKQCWIVAGKGLAPEFTTSDLDYILHEYMYPYLDTGNYGEGLFKTFKELQDMVGKIYGFQYSITKNPNYRDLPPPKTELFKDFPPFDIFFFFSSFIFLIGVLLYINFKIRQSSKSTPPPEEVLASTHVDE